MHEDTPRLLAELQEQNAKLTQQLSALKRSHQLQRTVVEGSTDAAVEALRASEERFSKVFQNSPDSMALVSCPDGRLIDVNDQFVEFTGHSREDAIGHTSLELGLWDKPTDCDWFVHISSEPEGVRAFEATLRTKSGERRDMQFSSDMIHLNEQRCLIAIGRDVTAQKQVEHALRESQARLQMVMQAGDVGLWDWNLLTNETFFSAEWKRHLGYADSEIAGRFEEWESRLHPDDRARTLAAVSDFHEGRSPDYDIEFRLRHKDGSWRWILARADMIRDTDGKPVRMMGCHVDITKRRQAEESLRASQAMLELILDSIPQGVFWKDRSSVYLGANRVSRQAIGFDTPESIIGKTDFDASSLNREQAEFYVRTDREVMNSDQPRFGIKETMTLTDGSTIWLETNKMPMHDAAGNVTGLLGTWQDITERQRADDELRASRERLAKLSRQLIEAQENERRHLARELHDEIGQALTGIKLNLKALQQPTRAPALGPLVQETIAVVDQTIQQVRNLALDLRPSILDEIGLVAALRWFFDRQAQRTGFAAHFFAEPAECRVSKDIETACFRVALESLTNISRHANARNVRLEVRQHNTELELLVHDDGIGFDVAAARDRATAGASLGLLGMQERVQLVGGQIEIESIPAQGTTIRVRFPISAELV